MKHRLFLAVEIPPEVSAPVAALQNRLERLNLPINWEPVEKLHLTLNFIGKVEDDIRHLLAPQISMIADNSSSFSLRPVFLETMYRKHEGSYVYLSPGGDMEALNRLQQELADVISRQQIAQPDKYFPHITIGKLKKMDPITTKEVLQQVRDVEFDPLPQFTVDHLTLFESLLSRDGSHYHRLSRYMLN